MADNDNTSDDVQDDQTDDQTDDTNDDATDDDPVATLTEELEDARKEIRSLRGKVAAAKRYAKPADEKGKPAKDDGPSEKETILEQQLAEATQRTRTLLAETIAAKLDFRDPDVAVRLLDWDLLDDPDDRTEVTDALKAMRKERPYLVSDGDDDTGAGRRGQVNRKANMNDLMRGALGRGPRR
jgi:hypothetical protein